VKRIRAQMDSVITASGFTGSFAEFVQFLRTDPRFYFTTPEDLLRASRDLTKRIDPELVKLFGTLPVCPTASPRFLRTPSVRKRRRTIRAAVLRRIAPARISSTPTICRRVQVGVEALTLHEAVPGHHLQIALAEELQGVPEFRRYGGYTAFIEAGASIVKAWAVSWGCIPTPTASSGSSRMRCGVRFDS